ncbi:uncharacterized mitochondrial protein AtMg00810-like [Brassica rapa]|uniref:uncharacterized mitochondrial protein AtMg00810-like n=1 Tax=Brassica napus TaxID=3708 RepID=UPI0006AB15DA|nr:uncharacterized mitochondrial protein AtMg00810-like [Brassica napus]XP_018513830.1 uncharacterized mitochondrial protein AtMg00810-like [Brassica rapa]
MAQKFEMTDLGSLTYYLGIKVHQCEEGTTLKQEQYAEKILAETGMKDCNVVQAPMEFGLNLSKAEDEQVVDEKSYRQMIGCLRYLLHTRPDLSFSVRILSRYMHKPKTSHTAALKQILRYLKVTHRYGLFFKWMVKSKLVGYSDSFHNIDEDDGQTTRGHEVIPLILTHVQSVGVRRNIKKWLYFHVKLNSWLLLRLLNKLYGCKS